MSTAFINALVVMSGPAKWGTREFTGPAIYSALVEELELESLLKTKLETILKPWDAYCLKIPAGPPNGSFTAWLKTCSVTTGTKVVNGGAIKSDAITSDFWEALVQCNNLIENKGVVRQWGEATCTKHHRYIAKKFKKDHLVKTDKEAEAHAAARLSSNPNVPASTSIDMVYVDGLDSYMKKLNEARVFSAVERYLNLTKGWNSDTASIDSVVWLSNSSVTAHTFKRKQPNKGLEKSKQSGRLVFAIQPDEADSKVRLIYHFSGIEANPEALAVTAPGAAWERVTFDQVRGKIPFDKGQEKIVGEIWPIVYYSI